MKQVSNEIIKIIKIQPHFLNFFLWLTSNHIFISRLNNFCVFTSGLHERERDEKEQNKKKLQNSVQTTIFMRDYIIKIVSAALKKKKIPSFSLPNINFYVYCSLLCTYTDWSVFEVIALTLLNVSLSLGANDTVVKTWIHAIFTC